MCGTLPVGNRLNGGSLTALEGFVIGGIMNDNSVSYPIAGDIGYVVVGEYRRRLTVELNVQAVRKLPTAVVSRRVLIAAKRALASAGGEDCVVELVLGDTGDTGDGGSGGLEPLAGSDP
jgi:hypothetical protein